MTLLSAGFGEEETQFFLLGNRRKKGLAFFVAENQGASSSIFKLKEAITSATPKLVRQLKLDMYRLDDVFTLQELRTFRHWVIDVQGAELQVLQGAGKLLACANSILIETKRVSEYSGGVGWEDLHDFLRTQGFQNLWTPIGNEEDNVLFIRNRR